MFFGSAFFWEARSSRSRSSFFAPAATALKSYEDPFTAHIVRPLHLVSVDVERFGDVVRIDETGSREWRPVRDLDPRRQFVVGRDRLLICLVPRLIRARVHACNFLSAIASAWSRICLANSLPVSCAPIRSPNTGVARHRATEAVSFNVFGELVKGQARREDWHSTNDAAADKRGDPLGDLARLDLVRQRERPRCRPCRSGRLRLSPVS